jgi:hypothetical protein
MPCNAILYQPSNRLAMNDDFEFDEQFPPDLYPIRLQGPWELVSLADPDSKPVRIRLPFTEEPHPDGRVRLTRRFQKPTNLDPEERVLLLLPGGVMASCCALNDREVAVERRIGSCEAVDLTPLLQDSNRLAIDVDLDLDDTLTALRSPILLGIMPDADGSWWQGLERVIAS